METVSNVHKKQKNKSTKVKLITLFASNVVGHRIRNAITGTEYDEKVGSIGEKLYWRVSNKDLERWGKNENGDRVLKTEGYDMAKYFFDSPEQYERLYNLEISHELKDQWYERTGKIRPITEHDE